MERKPYKKRDGTYWYDCLDEDEILGISKKIMRDIDRGIKNE